MTSFLRLDIKPVSSFFRSRQPAQILSRIERNTPPSSGGVHQHNTAFPTYTRPRLSWMRGTPGSCRASRGCVRTQRRRGFLQGSARRTSTPSSPRNELQREPVRSIGGLVRGSGLRMPNHSRHTFGKSENTLPCARPSIALAIQRLRMSSTLAAMTCEMKKNDEVSASE
jgi:hypothetical protein